MFRHHPIICASLLGVLAAEDPQLWVAEPVTVPGDSSKDNFDDPFGIEAGDWSLQIGASVEYEAAYPGSDDYEADFRPRLSASYWLNRRVGFAIQNQAAGVIVRPTPVLWLLGGAAWLEGREGDDSDDLDGFAEIEEGFGLLLGANYYPAENWEFGVAVAQDLKDDRHGLTIEFEGEYEYEITRSWEFGVEATALWADNTYQKSWSGVSAKQSAASGLDRFTAEAGVREVSMALELEWEPHRRVEIGLEAALIALLGDAADSPLTRDEIFPEIELSVTYEF